MPLSLLKNQNDILVIAEVGQNHQGSLDAALKYVGTFAKLGAHAIKFQVRQNKHLFHSSVYNMPYNSENSYGPTYGEHREALELKPTELKELKLACAAEGVYFMVTPFDEISLQLCVDLEVDILKVASFDMGNLPFLHLIAETGLPVVMSTGGATVEHISSSVQAIEMYHSNYALLHCVSKYPCPVEEVQIGKIARLAALYPNATIGISDHFNGILTGPVAYTQGARVFEKHVTFDRASKGTDHAFSLEPDGFRRYVRDIYRCPLLLSDKEQIGLGQEPVFKKLGKSIVCKRAIQRGKKIDHTDLSGIIVSPPGIPVRESHKIVGRIASSSISEGDLIEWSMIA